MRTYSSRRRSKKMVSFSTAWSLAKTTDYERLFTYRKPTHTDRLLDQSSYNPTAHKATTIRTLTRQAQLVCDSPDSTQNETDHLKKVFSKHNYNTDFVTRKTHSNTYSNTHTNVNSGPVNTATLPYIRDTSEVIARIQQPYNIRVTQKPITTLRQLLTNVKDKDKLGDRQGAVYKIKYCDCQATYFGETDRNLSTRPDRSKRASSDMSYVFYKLLSTTHFRKLVYASVNSCLVPRPHYSARPKRFGSRGPIENVRPR